MWWLSVAAAHEFRPAQLTLTEREPDSWAISWQRDARHDGLDLVWTNCSVELELARCEVGGAVAVRGLDALGSDAVVVVRPRDGGEQLTVLTSDDSQVVLHQQAPTAVQTATSFTHIGVEHIWFGYDHLLLVALLCWLLPKAKQLAATLTAFTLGHSITLVASSLTSLQLASGPVEAAIAASVLALAVSAARGEEDLLQRYPAIIAVLVGLIHGLGFAGALAEVGLPEQHRLVALVSFNVGVELGQLVVALALLPLLAAYKQADRWVLAPVYVAGTIAAAWTLERSLAVLTP